MKSPCSSARRVSTRSRSCFERDLAGAIRVEQAASVAKLSVSHFTRAFRLATGQSPLSYLRSCRVERAQQLMLRTDKSPAESALDCGFADPSHLCRILHRFVSSSPAAWRRKCQVSGVGASNHESNQDLLDDN